jgi:glucose-1-phosphate cytidylyltransferase
MQVDHPSAAGRGTRPGARDRGPAQAHGHDRRAADPVAHHEALRRTIGHRDFVLCLRYKGELIKDFFSTTRRGRTTSPWSLGGKARWRCTRRSRGAWAGRLPSPTPAGDATGGTPAARRQYLTERALPRHLRGRVCDLDLDALWRSTAPRQGGDGDGRASSRPLRGAGASERGGRVGRFAEMPQLGTGQINGGFFVFERRILDYLDDDALEQRPMQALTRDGEVMAYAHDGFWQCMDTVRELTDPRDLWDTARAPGRSGEPGRPARPRHRATRVQGAWLCTWLLELGGRRLGLRAPAPHRAQPLRRGGAGPDACATWTETCATSPPSAGPREGAARGRLPSGGAGRWSALPTPRRGRPSRSTSWGR